MKNLSELNKFIGHYKGDGINHEKQAFKGLFCLTPLLDKKGFEIKFKAVGNDGTIYHEEKSLIAPSMDEKLCLWNFNSNTPGLVPHELKNTESRNGSLMTFVFGFNDTNDKNAFREEVSLDLWESGEVSYTYSWGLPGGDFQERSGVKMKPQSDQTLSWPETVASKLQRSFQLYSDLIDFIPEETLAQKLPELPSNTLGQQLWCVVGARNSYLKALRAGEWQGFECPLAWDKTTSKAEVKNSLEAIANEITSFLKKSSEEVSKEILADLHEHEIQHHGQLVRYLYGLKLGVPESWKKRYSLD